MSISQIKGDTVEVRLWAPLHEVESAALTQLRNIASLPQVFHHVAAMPDVHLGKGATVGSVIAMKDAVSPAAVGVDIGCGMAAIRTNLMAGDLPDNLKELRNLIEAAIPVGNGPGGSHEDNIKAKASSYDPLDREIYDLVQEMPKVVADNCPNVTKQIGTLGGGNHFIELCIDTDQHVWLMLHSGSRNAGKTAAEGHLKIAKTLEHNQKMVDRDLAVFLSGTPEMNAYRKDLYWAQRYAFLNRAAMIRSYKAVIDKAFEKRGVKYDEVIQCHHNYVAEEVHFGEKVFVTRKGAIRAGKGELGIIPGSMGTRSYIVRGLGNPDSFESASHGAGRRMSRSAANKKFTQADMDEQTKGVECRKDPGVFDEIPAAYKDIDQVMANQADLVETVAILKQVLCVKG